MLHFDILLKDNKPLVGLAPMDGITDLPFRLIVSEYGNPDVVFTEFVHIIPLVEHVKNIRRVVQFRENEHPIIAQIFGKEPVYFYRAAKVIFALGFDGVDINMGCPDKRVIHSGGGASLIGNETLVLKIIESVKRARKEFLESRNKVLHGELALSVRKLREKFHITHHADYPTISIKTRIGREKNELKSWIPILNKTGVDFISLHGRTLRQMYKQKADWKAIGWAAKHLEIPLLGNGDIKTYSDALRKIKKYRLKGALIGRAALGNPFVFRKDYSKINFSMQKRKEVMLKHLEYFKHYKDIKKFYEMKKQLGWYLKGRKGCREKRVQVMKTNNFDEMYRIISSMEFPV